MFVSRCLDVNSHGHLTIGGCDTVELAQQFGTPLYLLDEGEVRRACASYRESIDRYYGGKGLVAYASKALNCKALCRIMQEEGMGLDVVSGGELYTALSVGFPAEKIFFHGNNKTPRELQEALEAGVGQIVVDNLTELELLSELAGGQGRTAEILLRIKPGVDAHTHQFIRTGQIDSKFGFALETGEAMQAVERALALPGVRLKGVHCHIGSQVFDREPFEAAAEIMVQFLADIHDRWGCQLEMLNLGGGFGIKYLSDHNPIPYGQYMEGVSRVVKEVCAQRGIATPFIVMEPGRSIVGAAGITLYTVGSVKTIPGIRTYVSVDGGMTDNPRYILYQSEYEALAANRADQPKDTVVTLAGRCCESGDLVGEGMPLQQVRPGDLVAVLSTGAYNYSMASNYNRVPRPALVLVRDGVPRLAIRRESYEDLVRNDL
ncbi:MAG TPA: diaminopimelate decarboxylase [Candidatus Anaerotruncus excrementipullorum]|uniref:Diaminopimelate decarboxylase n=1 Tax=Candidatus Anaerotruncus excrementipullorum TaxID=2838465 RepID=A0A9D2B801_9FIRM|nr:diaminopimelate decarboxylase [Candidatus Anaerotruncus excrementipullorum]